MSQQQTAAAAPQTAGPGAKTGASAGSGLAMLAIILGVFMAILDTSIVNVALPKMMSVFGVSQNDIEWVVTAYSLVSGALVPVTGYLGDKFGYKRMYLISMVVFTIGSGLCGVAWSNDSMIVFRIVQAIGGGAMMPISMAMIFRMFPPEKRGMAMGLFGIAIMFAPATGPTLSGYIVEYLDWRLIFTINVPIGIADFFLSLAVLKEFKSPNDPGKFDVLGFVTSFSGLAALLYGIGKVSEKGWTDPEVVGFLIAAFILLALFVTIELNIKSPMLDLRLMANYTFSIAMIISCLSTVIMMGILFLLPIFLQNLSGLSAVQTGLVMLPQALISGIMMPIAGGLYDKFGARVISVVGLAITAVGLYLTTYLDINTSFSVLIFWLCLRAAGMGLMMMPIQTAGMNTIPMHKVGQGTALSNTIRQIGASFGIAWLSLLFTDRQKFHAADMSEQLNMLSATVNEKLSELTNAYVSLGQSAAEAKTSALTYIASQVQIQGTIAGISDAFFMTVILCGVAAVFCLFLKETKKPKGEKGMHVMGE